MWSKRRCTEEAIKIFEVACQELNLNGSLAHDNEGKEYLVITAPDGAIRTYYIDLLILQHITDGWDPKCALWELRKDVIMGLETGYDQYCTSPFDLSDRDRDYMFDLATKLLEFFGQLPTY